MVNAFEWLWFITYCMHLQTIEQPTVETTITTDFTGETAKSVQIQLVPAGEKAVVSVRDVGIEACIEKGESPLFFLSF